MRKDDIKIHRQRYDNAYMTYYNGQYTDEFDQIVPLGFPSAHPTGRDKGFCSNLPSVIKAKARFKKTIEDGLKKRLEKK